MPRCLMAKKWKAYPWPDRAEDKNSGNSGSAISTCDSIVTLPEVSIQLVEKKVEPKSRRSTIDEDEEIDVVGDNVLANAAATATVIIKSSDLKSSVSASSSSSSSSSASPSNQSSETSTATATCWGPSSPTAGATAPSPPPHSPEAATRGTTTLYNGK